MSLGTEYRTGETNPAEGFYRPCLSRAVKYSRAAGYFRSSVFLVVGPDLVEFARRGGQTRLVCSPSISDEDVEGIQRGYDMRADEAGLSISREIDRLLADEATHYRTRVLATLVAVRALEIRVAVRRSGGGIYHEKLGVFRDAGGNRVSFLGSANETWKAWHEMGNHEAIEVFCSWIGGSDAQRVSRHEAYFERLWSGGVPGVEVVDFPEAARRKLVSAALEDLNDVDTTVMKAEGDSAPRTRRTALPHQSSAIAAWKEAGRKGVFEHATGSGKTFTALLAVREHVEAGLPALIVVPSRLLLKQWAEETREEIPDAALLLAGAGHDRWRNAGRLSAMTDPAPDLGPRIVLSTMQTAASDEFLGTIRGGGHLLVVADEVHQSGSPFNSKLYGLESGARLGLSATPIRYGDPVGTGRMFGYFGDVIPPSITLTDAINAGRLVEYEYTPHAVRMTAEEAEEWKRLTIKLRREIGGRSKGKSLFPLSDKAKMLLIRRSRIAKKAANKIALAADVLGKYYEDGHRWLVYCEDLAHLEAVIAALRERGLQPLRYHADMTADKDATLAHFRTFGGIIVSIRCLDEGVDIPAVDHALILASSQNPRQFVQRRGRVLRKAPWKNLAAIHDAIVVPVNLEDEPEQTSLLRSELVRAIEFAKSALNADAGAELRHIAATLGFDPSEATEVGIEEDEE